MLLTRSTEPKPDTLSPRFLAFLIAEHEQLVLPRLERLWDYYRNDIDDDSALGGATNASGRRAYRLAQERGLPARLRDDATSHSLRNRQREVVIENDIAWRIHALVDFMFGKPFALQSLAPDAERAAAIEAFLRRVFEANGAIGFFQDLALLGAVYGHVDVLLRTDAVLPLPQHLRNQHLRDASKRRDSKSISPSHPGGSPRASSPFADADASTAGGAPAPRADEHDARRPAHLSAAAHRPATRGGPASFNHAPAVQHAIDQAGRFVLETIEAPRAIPVLNPSDYRMLDAYVLHYRQVLNAVDDAGVLARLRDRVLGRAALPGVAGRRATVECTEVWTAGHSQLLLGNAGSDARGNDARTGNDHHDHDGEHAPRTQSHTINRLGRIPVVHIQNLPQPFFYEGLSEVEPLVPLQDELNTRLSDRANRVTFQSFKMYLGKGIDKFLDRPVGPGQMWATDNPDASIEAFGGDAACPSEEQHINEIREAMDKVSAVTPLAAGVLRDRVGNLTSENALRITMMGMLARTEKKRITYGAGIERLCELILHAADVLGAFPNSPAERRVRIDWPNPIPVSEHDMLRNAQLKRDLGVSQAQVLAELGYDECPAE